jgi:hypothetical protein
MLWWYILILRLIGCSYWKLRQIFRENKYQRRQAVIVSLPTWIGYSKSQRIWTFTNTITSHLGVCIFCGGPGQTADRRACCRCTAQSRWRTRDGERTGEDSGFLQQKLNQPNHLRGKRIRLILKSADWTRFFPKRCRRSVPEPHWNDKFNYTEKIILVFSERKKSLQPKLHPQKL